MLLAEITATAYGVWQLQRPGIDSVGPAAIGRLRRERFEVASGTVQNVHRPQRAATHVRSAQRACSWHDRGADNVCYVSSDDWLTLSVDPPFSLAVTSTTFQPSHATAERATMGR